MVKPITDFSAGELSPRMAGRMDLPLYSKGSRKLENWIPFLQGGITTRPGLKHIGAVKTGNTGGVRLVSFIISENIAYLLEMGVVSGVGYMRFWYNDALVLNGESQPIEFLSTDNPSSFPYTTLAKINEIQFAQDGADLYFAQRDYSPRLLSRSSAGAFSMGAISVTGNSFALACVFTNGSTAVTGVGASYIMRLSVGDHLSGTGMAAGATITAVGESGFTMSANATASGTSLTVAKLPFQASEEYPGCVAIWGGRLWWASSIKNPQSVLVSEVWDPGTKYSHYHYFDTIETTTLMTKAQSWSFTASIASGAYKLTGLSADDKAKLSAGDKITGTGIPSNTSVVSTVYANSSQDLLAAGEVLINNPATQTVTSGSFTGSVASEGIIETYNYTSVKDVVSDSNALNFSVGSDQLEKIMWLAAGVNLVIGTTITEFIVPQGVTALSAQADPYTRKGSYPMQARLFDRGLLFLQAGGTRMFQYLYTDKGSAYQSPDLTFFAEHILTPTGGQGIIGFDFSQSAQPMVYCVRYDGTLAVLVHSLDYNVTGWSRVIPGDSGLIKSVAVITNISGSDDVYVAVQRGSVHYIEKFDPLLAPVYNLDHYYSYTKAGETTKTITEFASKTVHIVSAGVSYTATADGAGVVTLPALAVGALYAIGLPYTCSGETLRITKEMQGNPGVSNFKRVINVMFLLLSSYSFEASSGEAIWDAVTLTGPYSGDINVAISGDHDTDATVSFRQTASLPVTILAILPEVV